MIYRLSCLVSVVFILFAGVLISPGQTAPTTDVSVGPLRIHVIAVQGGAQYRASADTKWAALKPDLDLTEGVEFRTGPKGAIQFTVGTDQVYRVDRLTAVKVLRASLLPDGTIKTDVGMTYGRVSKDVDEPDHPHQDTIVCPSSTLAIRGTRVALYDQPPFAPEAISLTGTATITNVHGVLTFGSKGGGTVRANDTSVVSGVAAESVYLNNVNPAGTFAGQTTTEQQESAALSNVLGTTSVPLGPLNSIVRTPQNTNGLSLPLAVDQELFFTMFWTGPAFTQVDFTVRGPDGQTVSVNNPTVSSGGMYFTGSTGFGPTANSSGNGQQAIDWGNLTSKSPFPLGTYTITETLTGTQTQTLAENPNTAVTTELFAIREHPKANGSLQTKEAGSGAVVLNATDPTAAFTSNAPSNVSITLTQTGGNAPTTPALARKAR